VIEKIGVALITYNRPEYFKQSYELLSKYANYGFISELVVIRDGGSDVEYPIVDDYPMITLIDNQGVGRCKNLALSFLTSKKCEHLFLVEEDILVNDPYAFKRYINTSKVTGLKHLMFSKINKNPKIKTILYEDGRGVDFHQNFQGAFMYMRKDLLDVVGPFDVGYMNAFEHADWSFMCVRRGYLPSMWWSPDVMNSDKYISEIEGATENSSITNKGEYAENVNMSAMHWKHKYGGYPNEARAFTEEKVLENLKTIKEKYSEKL